MMGVRMDMKENTVPPDLQVILVWYPIITYIYICPTTRMTKNTYTLVYIYSLFFFDEIL